jgi:hypothetical protein
LVELAPSQSNTVSVNVTTAPPTPPITEWLFTAGAIGGGMVLVAAAKLGEKK